MSTPRFSSLLAARVCGLTLAFAAPSHAAPAETPKDLGSAHYDTVSSHLEIGGVFYSYVDVDGDLAALGNGLNRIFKAAGRDGKWELPENLDVAKIADSLGLTSVRALGLSSRKLEGNLYHNRAFVHTPGGLMGLLRLFGDKAKPFTAPAATPAGADFVMEQELTLSSLAGLVEEVLKDSGNEALSMQFRAALGFPVPGMPMTFGDFLAKLDTRVVAAARLDGNRKLKLPGTETVMPAFQAVVNLDNLGFLFEPLTAMAADKNELQVEKGEGFVIIRSTTSLPGDLDYFRPVVYHDIKSGRILLGTHLDYVKECLAPANPLSADPAFVKATEGLPKEGNSLNYATPAVMRAAHELTESAAKTKKGKKDGAAALDEMLSILRELTPEPSSSVAGVMACLPDGLLFQSNMADSHKNTMAQLAVVPAAMAAGAMQGWSKAGDTGRRDTPESREEPDSGDDGPEAESASTGITNNLRQVAFAAQSYFIDNPSAAEVTYGRLVGDDLLYELDPLSGESYKGLKLMRKGGTLSVKTGEGATVTLQYPPVTD